MGPSAFVFVVQFDHANPTARRPFIFASIQPQLLWAIKYLMDLDDSVLLPQFSVFRLNLPVESNPQPIALAEADLVIVYSPPKCFVLDRGDHRCAFVKKAPGTLFRERKFGNNQQGVSLTLGGCTGWLKLPRVCPEGFCFLFFDATCS